MELQWSHRKLNVIVLNLVLILSFVNKIQSCASAETVITEKLSDKELKKYVDQVLSVDSYRIVPGVVIEKSKNENLVNASETCGNSGRSLTTIEDYVQDKFRQYTRTHVLSVNLPDAARFFKVETGKSSFMTGFGMGFLAFALKKLLLPVFIGAQLVKSVLIAMFLPSILGGLGGSNFLGKLVGKGLSTFSGVSGASAGVNNHQQNSVEDFEFKDTGPYNAHDGLDAADADASSSNMDSSTSAAVANSRFEIDNKRITYTNSIHDGNYYMRKPTQKRTDYKVFHKIPTSSLLLTSYDPFYSPLLSRLDAVFQQLGLGNDKTLPETESCRERLVCLMYANPAKYAPYSNLVSAQLSRELNELRKPSSENPEILRFFKYMKAAKDGQDGEECLEHGGCPSLSAHKPSPALLTTYNDINKLVQARKLK